MNSDHGKDFEKNMNHLVKLLRKIIKGLPFGSLPAMPGKEKENGINVNFCFFNFLPTTPEELEELDEIYEQFLSHEEDREAEFSSDLNPSDLDFLRRNGIRF